MALYAIADLHLSFGTDKPMDIFKGWENYTERLEEQWRQTVQPDDAVVLAGDLSWAMRLEETLADFTFINALPGKKYVIKGNHDYWWCTKQKMDTFLKENGLSTLEIIHNSAAAAEQYAVCGTRGWFFEEKETDKKVILREAGRLRASIEAGEKLGLKPVVFLHYPPVYGDYRCPEILDVLKEKNIDRCYFGHIHGPQAKRYQPVSEEGITFHLISCDHTGFKPVWIE